MTDSALLTCCIGCLVGEVGLWEGKTPTHIYIHTYIHTHTHTGSATHAGLSNKTNSPDLPLKSGRPDIFGAHTKFHPNIIYPGQASKLIKDLVFKMLMGFVLISGPNHGIISTDYQPSRRGQSDTHMT